MYEGAGFVQVDTCEMVDQDEKGKDVVRQWPAMVREPAALSFSSD